MVYALICRAVLTQTPVQRLFKSIALFAYKSLINALSENRNLRIKFLIFGHRPLIKQKGTLACQSMAIYTLTLGHYAYRYNVQKSCMQPLQRGQKYITSHDQYSESRDLSVFNNRCVEGGLYRLLNDYWLKGSRETAQGYCLWK